MTRIYLSGPITGNTDYIEDFDKAEEDVYGLFGGTDNVTVINPAGLRYVMPDGATWDEYMKMCIGLLVRIAGDGIVYMLPGWRKSPGACVEYGYALAHDIQIIQAERGK